MILVGTASVRARNLALVATTLLVLVLVLVLGFATAASAAPSLGTLSPSSAWAGDDAFVLVVDGDGFIQGSSQVLWNGSPRTTTWVSPNRLTAAISKADIDQATTVSVQVTSGAETSGALGFAINNPRPYVYDFDPQSRVRGSGRFILTVKGSGFVRGSKVLWNGAERTTEYIDHQTLTADILAADVAARGTASVQVVSPPPTPQGGLSYTSTYYVTDPLPVITSLDPAQGVVGSNGTTLSIGGLNFVPGAKVNWEVCADLDGCSYDGTRGQFVSSTELRIAVSAQELARSGRAYVWVENPNGYPEVTDTRTWVIGQAPNTAPAMPADVQLLGQDDATGVLHAFSSAPFVWPGTTLMGRARFADKEGGPLTIEVNWRYINGTYQDYRLLTKSVPGPGVYDFPLPNLGPGAFVARVRARDSEGVAGDWHFFLPTDPDWTVVSGQPPLVTSLSPSSVTAGGPGRTITVDGAGFTPGAVVQWNGEARPTTFVSTSRLTATMSASDLAVPAGATMRVSNAAFNAPPGGRLSNATPFDVMGTSPPSVPLPVSIVPPSVAGSPQVGGLLSCSAGTWANGPTGFGFAWLRDGQAIPGATGSSYFANIADSGRQLACRVTAANAGGVGTAVSDAVAVGAASIAVTVAPVSGPTPAPSTGTVVVAPRRLVLLAPLSVRAGRPFRLALRFDRPARKLLVLVQVRRGGRFVKILSRRVSGVAPLLKITLGRRGRQIIRVTWRSQGGVHSSAPVVVLVLRARASSSSSSR